jgi:hypothetical protein
LPGENLLVCHPALRSNLGETLLAR